MEGNTSGQFTGGSRRDIFADDDPEYDADASAEIGAEDEPGPFYLPYNYRSDVMQIRRYI